MREGIPPPIPPPLPQTAVMDPLDSFGVACPFISLHFPGPTEEQSGSPWIACPRTFPRSCPAQILRCPALGTNRSTARSELKSTSFSNRLFSLPDSVSLLKYRNNLFNDDEAPVIFVPPVLVSEVESSIVSGNDSCAVPADQFNCTCNPNETCKKDGNPNDASQKSERRKREREEKEDGREREKMR